MKNVFFKVTKDFAETIKEKSIKNLIYNNTFLGYVYHICSDMQRRRI